MMYNKPEMEVIELSIDDIVATSGFGYGEEGDGETEPLSVF